MPGSRSDLLSVVAVDAMLPEVVDNPLVMYLLRKQLRNGRIYGHAQLLSRCLGRVAGGHGSRTHLSAERRAHRFSPM